MAENFTSWAADRQRQPWQGPPAPGGFGELTATTPSLRDRLADLVGGLYGGGKAGSSFGRNAAGLADFVPGVGQALAAGDATQAANEGDWQGASLAALGAVPGVGPEAKALATGGREALAGIRAFHGSPHSFDQFDLSKIGTGEGAQAFGHGLYFAGDEGVADSYRKALSGPDQSRWIEARGQPLDLEALRATDPQAHSGALEYHVRQSYLPPEGATEKIRKGLSTTIENFEGGHIPMDERAYSDAKDALHFIDNYQPAITPEKRAGSMYEVNLNADPEHLFDLDVPLHQQSGPVRQRLDTLGVNTQPPTADMDALRRSAAGIPATMKAQPNMAPWVHKDMDELLGGAIGGSSNPRDLYRLFQDFPREYGIGPGASHNMPPENRSVISQEAVDQIMETIRALRVAATPPQSGTTMLKTLEDRFGGRPEAAAKLNEAGVPGIKYLDAGSRSAGDGSRNYVVFDPKIIEIVKKYGIAGALGAGLISQEMASQMQQQTGGDHAI